MSYCRSQIIGYMKVRLVHVCCGAECIRQFPKPEERKGKVISINSHEALVHYVKNWNGNAYTNPRGGCVSECKYCEPKKFARAKTRRALQPKLRGRSYWKPGPRDWDVVESWHKFKERKGEDNG